MNFILTVLGVAFGGAIIIGCIIYLLTIITALAIAEDIKEKDKRKKRTA